MGNNRKHRNNHSQKNSCKKSRGQNALNNDERENQFLSDNSMNDEQEKSTENEIEKCIERNRYSYELVNGWINNADNKVSVSCAVLTGIFGVISFMVESNTDANIIHTNLLCQMICKINLQLSFIYFALGILCFLIAIIPSLKSSCEKKLYPIFFGDIAVLTETEYKKLMDEGTTKSFYDELVIETHINAKVCMKKMLAYKWGVILSGLAILFSLIVLSIYRFAYFC